MIKALCELDRIKTLDGCLCARENAVGRARLARQRQFGDQVLRQLRAAMEAPGAGRCAATGADAPCQPATRELLAALYRPDASEAEGAAIMWFYRNALFFEQQLAADPRVRVVFYEDLVRHPWREVAAVYDFLGLHGFQSAGCRAHSCALGQASQSTGHRACRGGFVRRTAGTFPGVAPPGTVMSVPAWFARSVFRAQEAAMHRPTFSMLAELERTPVAVARSDAVAANRAPQCTCCRARWRIAPGMRPLA